MEGSRSSRASRGIGAGIAQRFAAEGASVTITARTVNPGDARTAASEQYYRLPDDAIETMAEAVLAHRGPEGSDRPHRA